jgi:hypothetical protein
MLGRTHEVAFVLAILVVHDDEHTPLPELGKGVVDGVE